MFDGDIICRSELGQGCNFIFIVAVGFEQNKIISSRQNEDESNDRIKNPDRYMIEYSKIKMDKNQQEIER